ncbi:MAG TPA: TonB-dependent receptor plug domain-containing protein [Steroidobacteraceae bacterium]|nr:TonB-dependent receptor plug domain-containing protein [Steroidobacteraceae bacterium]
MNHSDDHFNRRHRGWLVAPLLFMVAVCANAQTNTQKGAQVKTQKSAQLLAKKDAKKTPLLLAQNDAKKTPQLLAQAGPPQPPSNSAAKKPVLTEVVITGSRIARAANDTLQPTVVVSSATIENRGFTTASQALDEMPEFGVPPTSQQNQQSAFSVGQSFVDLFSLGSQRTLTLIDGRRFVSSNTASLFGAASPGTQVDFNVIPVQLIDHIETISVGGAPIYGADAIAGTVNVILKHDYQGLDLQAASGIANQGDAFNFRISALAGHNFADGRGNVTGVVEFSKSTGLRGTARSVYADQGGFEAPAVPGKYQTVWTPDPVVNQLSTSGVPYLDNLFYTPSIPDSAIGFTNASGQPLAFSPGSSALSPYDLGTATGNPIFYSGGAGINLIDFSNLQAYTERINADMLGHFDWTDHVQTFWEGWFSEDHSHSLIAQPFYSATIFGNPGTPSGPLLISVNNPYLSVADRTLIQNEMNAYAANGYFFGGGAPLDPNWNPNFFYLDRGSTDLEAGRFSGDQVVARGVAGMKGDFAAFGNSYHWDFAANYGYSRNISRNPVVVFQNLENAINPVVNGSGQIVCPPGAVNSPISTESSTCAPLDIFGEGNPSAAAKAYVTHIALADSYNTQRDVTADLTGPIVKLPAGQWQFALGFENRRESANFEPDAFYTSSPPAGDQTASAIEGSYHTNEVYAETLIPVFEPQQHIPALHKIELEGAIRRVDNSIAGNSNTYTYGMRWAPTRDILFRGNRTVSIRSPAITELFLPSSTSNEFAQPDPCDMNFVNQGPDPAIRKKNCQAAGINTSTFTSNAINATVQGMTSGNAGLVSETAKSYTYGVVLTPRWIPSLSIDADYIDINMANAIEQFNLSNILEACYDSPDYPNTPECKDFTRNAAGQLTSYHDGFVNAGLLHFQGDTIAFTWNMELPRNFGRMSWTGQYLDTKTLKLQIGHSTPLNEAGELGASIIAPKDRFSVSTNYVKGSFDWYWQAQYTSQMNFSNLNTPTSQNYLTVGHWWLINSSIGYYVTDSLNLRLVVDNVFDKEPPALALSAAAGNFFSGTSYYFAGIIGRTYQLTIDWNVF